MYMYGEVEVQLHTILTLALLYPQGKNVVTYWTGGWVGPRAGMNAVVKRKTLSSHALNPGCSVHSQSLQ
jgi:hypothetical protein